MISTPSAGCNTCVTLVAGKTDGEFWGQWGSSYGVIWFLDHRQRWNNWIQMVPSVRNEFRVLQYCNSSAEWWSPQTGTVLLLFWFTSLFDYFCPSLFFFLTFANGLMCFFFFLTLCNSICVFCLFSTYSRSLCYYLVVEKRSQCCNILKMPQLFLVLMNINEYILYIFKRIDSFYLCLSNKP